MEVAFSNYTDSLHSPCIIQFDFLNRLLLSPKRIEVGKKVYEANGNESGMIIVWKLQRSDSLNSYIHFAHPDIIKSEVIIPVTNGSSSFLSDSCVVPESVLSKSIIKYHIAKASSDSSLNTSSPMSSHPNLFPCVALVNVSEKKNYNVKSTSRTYSLLFSTFPSVTYPNSNNFLKSEDWLSIPANFFGSGSETFGHIETLERYIIQGKNVEANQSGCAGSWLILFQLVDVLAFAHSKGQCLCLSPRNIMIDELKWVFVNGIHPCCNVLPARPIYDEMDSILSNKVPRPIEEESLVSQWANGRISNYDYLMILNGLAGRRKGSHPLFYPILPWVVDFKSHGVISGLGNLRDLTKTKFRLTKGDEQLDSTFRNSPCPHHVPDLFSEVTYFVYLSRKMPISALKYFVRKTFEPSEYPSTMERLYEWSPDEAIPEFYTDPSIFKSMHPKMKDLEIPSGFKSPEEFIKRHREVLESQEISQQLHHWIDLNFGHKMSGPEAIKAKNVMLPLVEGSDRLIKHGIKQLFKMAHPVRRPISNFCSEKAVLTRDVLDRCVLTESDKLYQRDSADFLSPIDAPCEPVASHGLETPSVKTVFSPSYNSSEKARDGSFLGFRRPSLTYGFNRNPSSLVNIKNSSNHQPSSSVKAQSIHEGSPSESNFSRIFGGGSGYNSQALSQSSFNHGTDGSHSEETFNINQARPNNLSSEFLSKVSPVSVSKIVMPVDSISEKMSNLNHYENVCKFESAHQSVLRDDFKAFQEIYFTGNNANATNCASIKTLIGNNTSYSASLFKTSLSVMRKPSIETILFPQDSQSSSQSLFEDSMSEMDLVAENGKFSYFGCSYPSGFTFQTFEDRCWWDLFCLGCLTISLFTRNPRIQEPVLVYDELMRNYNGDVDEFLKNSWFSKRITKSLIPIIAYLMNPGGKGFTSAHGLMRSFGWTNEGLPEVSLSVPLVLYSTFDFIRQLRSSAKNVKDQLKLFIMHFPSLLNCQASVSCLKYLIPYLENLYNLVKVSESREHKLLWDNQFINKVLDPFLRSLGKSSARNFVMKILLKKIEVEGVTVLSINLINCLLVRTGITFFLVKLLPSMFGHLGVCCPVRSTKYDGILMRKDQLERLKNFISDKSKGPDKLIGCFAFISSFVGPLKAIKHLVKPVLKFCIDRSNEYSVISRAISLIHYWRLEFGFAFVRTAVYGTLTCHLSDMFRCQRKKNCTMKHSFQVLNLLYIFEICIREMGIDPDVIDMLREVVPFCLKPVILLENKGNNSNSSNFSSSQPLSGSGAGSITDLGHDEAHGIVFKRLLDFVVHLCCSLSIVEWENWLLKPVIEYFDQCDEIIVNGTSTDLINRTFFSMKNASYLYSRLSDVFGFETFQHYVYPSGFLEEVLKRNMNLSFSGRSKGVQLPYSSHNQNNRFESVTEFCNEPSVLTKKYPDLIIESYFSEETPYTAEESSTRPTTILEESSSDRPMVNLTAKQSKRTTVESESVSASSPLSRKFSGNHSVLSKSSSTLELNGPFVSRGTTSESKLNLSSITFAFQRTNSIQNVENSFAWNWSNLYEQTFDETFAQKRLFETRVKKTRPFPLEFKHKLATLKIGIGSASNGSVKRLVSSEALNILATVSKDKKARIWSLNIHPSDGKDSHWGESCFLSEVSTRKSILDVYISERQPSLIVCDGNLLTFDLTNEKPRRVFESDSSSFFQVSELPRLGVFAALETDSIQFFNSLSLKKAFKWVCGSMLSGSKRTFSISKSENLMAIGFSSGRITLMDTRTGESLHEWKAHENEISQLSFYRDQYLVSSSLNDHMIHIWDISQNFNRSSFLMDSVRAHSEVFSFNIVEGFIFVLSSNGMANLFALENDSADGDCHYKIPGQKSSQSTVFGFSLEHELLLLGADDGSVQVYK